MSNRKTARQDRKDRRDVLPVPPFVREPEFDGLAKVWPSRDVRIADPEQPTLAAALIFAPLAHPLWSWHHMAVVHLRPWPGQPPAKLVDPTMTHELMVFAIDPYQQHVLDPDNADTWKVMFPQDAVAQVSLPDDNAAIEMFRQVCRAVAAGMLVPDSDYSTYWNTVLTNTAEHIRTGGHPR